MRNKVLTIGLILAIAFSVVGVGMAYSGTAQVVIENVEQFMFQSGEQDFGMVGGRTASTWRAANLISDGYLTVEGNITQGVGTITATTTLTSTSENIQFISASANAMTVTLPAVTETGSFFRFQVDGALTGGFAQITSAEKDNISGTLIVAGAVVDCRDEDFINIITDGEVIGDYVEFISNGTQWLLVDSGVLTAGKMTCTDPS